MATGSVTAADALLATEWAKKLSDDAYSAEDHRKAAKAHRRAAQLHGYTTAGADAVGWHESAALQHRQAAEARTSRAYKAWIRQRQSDASRPIRERSLLRMTTAAWPWNTHGEHLRQQGHGKTVMTYRDVVCPVCHADIGSQCLSLAKRWQNPMSRTVGIGDNGWRKTPHSDRVKQTGSMKRTSEEKSNARMTECLNVSCPTCGANPNKPCCSVAARTIRRQRQLARQADQESSFCARSEVLSGPHVASHGVRRCYQRRLRRLARRDLSQVSCKAAEHRHRLCYVLRQGIRGLTRIEHARVPR